MVSSSVEIPSLSLWIPIRISQNADFYFIFSCFSGIKIRQRHRKLLTFRWSKVCFSCSQPNVGGGNFQYLIPAAPSYSLLRHLIGFCYELQRNLKPKITAMCLRQLLSPKFLNYSERDDYAWCHVLETIFNGNWLKWIKLTSPSNQHEIACLEFRIIFSRNVPGVESFALCKKT